MAQSALSRRLSEFAGVALFATTLLWLVALVSHSSNDPAWFWNSVTGDPSNFAGRIGAFMAETAFQLLGFAAWFIPALFGYVAWHYFWCTKIEAEYTKLVGAGLLVGSVAALLSLAGGALESSTRHYTAGGMVGQGLASLFSIYLNRTGATILLLTLLAFSIILSTQFSFGLAATSVAERIRARRGPLDWFRSWRENRERDRERERIVQKQVKQLGKDLSLIHI